MGKTFFQNIVNLNGVILFPKYYFIKYKTVNQIFQG